MLALGVVIPAHAQGFRVSGTVVRVGERDSTPLGAERVVLHQVTIEGGGPVDSAFTDARGRYRLRAPSLDTAATYLVSVEHDGIGYFSSPIHTFGANADTASTLAVYDTSSVVPNIALSERHLVVRAAQPDGSRRVVELFVLANRGFKTRIANDSTRPVWQGALPSDAMQFEVGESDVSAQAVSRRGDSVVVLAPVPPGDRQLLVSYLLPGSVERWLIPVDPPAERFHVLLEDTTATLAAGPLALAGVEELDDLRFRRFTGGPLLAGTDVIVQFSRKPQTLVSLSWVIVVLAGLALAAGFWYWQRGQPKGVQAADAGALAAEIAQLDDAFDRRAQVSPREREEYERRRAGLKARLTAALQSRRP